MELRKENGGRFFKSTPETQIELELLMSKMDFISAVGASARLHREELERLNRQIDTSREEMVTAPEGHVFCIGIRGGEFPLSRFYPLGSDSYWDNVRTERFGKYLDDYVFVANSIAAERSHNWADAGSVYAYSSHEGYDERIRCRLEPGKYSIKLCPADQIPQNVVNPVRSIESVA